MTSIKTNFILVFLIHFCFSSFSQVETRTYDYQCVYQLNYQPDSTSPQKLEEYFFLFLGKDFSLFQGINRFEIDSAMVSENNKGNLLGGPPMTFFAAHQTRFYNHFFKTNEFVESYETVSRVQSYSYFYKQPKPLFNWEVLADTSTIGGYHCQKAITTFGHRKWEAWFTSELPFSDGPYKFCGLPGLIVQIQDSKEAWKYSLIDFKQKSRTFKPLYMGNKPINIKSQEQYFKRKIAYYKNPLEMDEALGGFSITTGRDIYIEKRKKENEVNNNWIELYKP